MQSPQLGSQGFQSCKLLLATRVEFPKGLFWTKGCAGDGAILKDSDLVLVSHQNFLLLHRLQSV